jgi:tetratricopeptide (TPR) repeat protein
MTQRHSWRRGANLPALAALIVAVAASGCAALASKKETAATPASAPSAAPPVAAGNATFTQQFVKGRNFELSGDLEKARAAYDDLARRFPRRFEPYHRLGVIHDRQRRYVEAEEMFALALQRDPANAEVFNDLGYCFFLQGQLGKAESALAKAVRLAPNVGRYQNNLGLVYGHQRRYDEALAAFRRGGSEPDAHYNMAFVFASQHNAAAAKACFQRALAVDPTHDRARRALRSFEQAEQEGDDPTALADELHGGGHYVPFEEPGSLKYDDQVMPASASSPSPSAVSTRPSLTPLKHDAAAVTRSLHSQARADSRQRLSAP